MRDYGQYHQHAMPTYHAVCFFCLHSIATVGSSETRGFRGASRSPPMLSALPDIEFGVRAYKRPPGAGVLCGPAPGEPMQIISAPRGSILARAAKVCGLWWRGRRCRAGLSSCHQDKTRIGSASAERILCRAFLLAFALALSFCMFFAFAGFGIAGLSFFGLLLFPFPLHDHGSIARCPHADHQRPMGVSSPSVTEGVPTPRCCQDLHGGGHRGHVVGVLHGCLFPWILAEIRQRWVEVQPDLFFWEQTSASAEVAMCSDRLPRGDPEHIPQLGAVFGVFLKISRDTFDYVRQRRQVSVQEGWWPELMLATFVASVDVALRHVGHHRMECSREDMSCRGHQFRRLDVHGPHDPDAQSVPPGLAAAELVVMADQSQPDAPLGHLRYDAEDSHIGVERHDASSASAEAGELGKPPSTDVVVFLGVHVV